MDRTVEVYHLREEEAAADPESAARIALGRGEDSVRRLLAAWIRGGYRLVARMTVERAPDPAAALDSAWRLTQHIDADWTLDPRAGAVLRGSRAHRVRSSMTGDVFVVDGRPHAVAFLGFAPLPEGTPSAPDAGEPE